jgi:hypothetical protein
MQGSFEAINLLNRMEQQKNWDSEAVLFHQSYAQEIGHMNTEGFLPTNILEATKPEKVAVLVAKGRSLTGE